MVKLHFAPLDIVDSSTKIRAMIKHTEVRVFTYQGKGGNPCSVVLDASALSTNEMQEFARMKGHECGFCLPAESPNFDYRFRYFVPNHEMEMCGHATLGILWSLAHNNLLETNNPVISTKSGVVRSKITINGNVPVVRISQPEGCIENVSSGLTKEVLTSLNIGTDELLEFPVQNASTSRTKTLIPLATADSLQSIRPAPEKIRTVCSQLNSTGLYPYIVHDLEQRIFEARQFPKNSGYIEDPATAIAASALAYGLLSIGLVNYKSNAEICRLKVFQGRTMGSLSEIEIELHQTIDAPCWIAGRVYKVR